ncbi:hypothetical protein EES43_09835 [Streptomyces sp. ADI96-02]|uniref:peptidase n=1 Tax=Streptomyces sp. ADI96-02 TaxID=1522760 RepID=UPI000F55736E|nr:peptidase [Streptomyces sp. ADI96-02]RPK64332.1 hypothetical protein EES43_09835 [Streptomyces sp. ADI96-02]
MPPSTPARLHDGRARTAALGLAAGIAVPVLLGGPQAAALPSLARAASVAAEEQPGCGDTGARAFPIKTRIHDAPDTYASGGGFGTWLLDLTNTTSAPCRALHPVLVLTDRDRELASEQIRLTFSEPARPGTEHRVSWETTDRDEQIGVFDGGDPDGDFLGITVPAGRTVTVRVRMAFTSDTRPARVTAHAAVVQRRHQDRAKGGGRDDGEWVGESGAYAFEVVDGVTGRRPEPDATPPERAEPHPTPSPAAPSRPAPPDDATPPPPPVPPDATAPGVGKERLPAGEADPDPDRDSDPGSGTRPPVPPTSPVPSIPSIPSAPSIPPDGGVGTVPGTGRDGDADGPGRPPGDAGHPLPELARTGSARPVRTGAAAGALIICGGALVLRARRMRRDHG